MKKVVLFLAISLLVFGSLSVAQEPDERIEESITKLEQVQELLEEGDKEEAASALAEVKSEITQARFQLMTTETERTLVGNQWAVKFPDELSIKTKINYSDEYFIKVEDVMVKNQADEERYTASSWMVYLLDPEGIQRDTGHYSTSPVLPGSTKYIGWSATIEKSKFVPGTYTILFKPRFESEPEELRFNIELSEEDFSE